jgi:hypothetical protein
VSVPSPADVPSNVKVLPQTAPGWPAAWTHPLGAVEGLLPKSNSTSAAFEGLAPKASAAIPTAILRSAFCSINPSPDIKIPTMEWKNTIRAKLGES